MFPEVLGMFYNLVKGSLQGNVPIQWDGSVLQEIYKGKGDTHVCKSFRDGLLADVIGKIAKRYSRVQILPSLNSYILDSVCVVSSTEVLIFVHISALCILFI